MLKTWIIGTKDFTDQGLAPSEWTNDNVTIVDGGKLGKCMYFNGTSSRISTTGYTLSNKWSWACWVKEDPSVTTWQGIIALNNNGSDNDMQTALWLKANEHRFEVCNNTKYNSTIQYTQGQWNHYAMSFDGTTTIAYLNGIQVATFTSSSILSRTNLTIGARSSNANGGHTSATNFLKGYINDLRIWDDEAISPLQVKQLSQGLVLHYPLDNNGIGGENLLTGTNNGAANWEWTMQVGDFTKAEETTLSGVKGCKFTRGSTAQSGWSVIYYSVVDESVFEPSTNYILSVDIYSSVSTSFVASIRRSNALDAFTTNSSTQSVTQNKWNHVRFNLTTVSTLPSSTGEVIYFQNMNSDTGVSYIFRNLKLEKGDKATPWCPNPSDSVYSLMGLNDSVEYDCSGFGNNGTRVGEFSWSTDTPRYLASTHIGATNQKIHISNFPTSGFGNSYSFSWWGKRNSNDPMFWGFSDGIRLNGMYTGRLWNTGNSSQNPIYRPNTTNTITAPSINEWHHYVMTGDGTTCKLYLDGELYGQAKTYKAISGTSIYINGWDSGTQYCSNNTDISDFRIYATALSASDVLSLYQNSAYIDSSGNVYGAVHEEV